jgi:hypothetical protein
VEKDPKKKDDPEKILQKKGKNVVVLKSELLRSVLLVEETGVPEENHRSATSH